MNMDTIPLLMHLLALNLVLGADTECPLDLDYVSQLPWDRSSCNPVTNKANCCQTLLGLIGIGFARHLKDTSMFELPSHASAVSCLGIFRQQLESLALSPDLVGSCFQASSFVSSPLHCYGINTTQDWIRTGLTSSMDSACKGDLSNRISCSACCVSGILTFNMLTNKFRNLTNQFFSSEGISKCLEFTWIYAAGVVNEFGPQNIDTAKCVLGLSFVQNASDRRVLTYASICIAIGFVLVCALGLCYYMLGKKSDPTAVHRRFVRKNEKLLKAVLRPNNGAVRFDIRLIRNATDNFSDANFIGQGGFGTVYRGTLPNSRQIAVKRIRNCTPEGDSEFLNEVETINSVRQRNLVSLRGFCVASDKREGHQRFLIYDYMPNGSLDEHIFGQKSKAQPLDWPQRRNIVLGTAKGLAYLHNGIGSPIYHRDVKATNILLDDEMNACVADFGLARMMTQEGRSHTTTKVAGTYGYLAPEYALYGQLTEKSDVYSFGILLLEIMSGRKAMDTSAESTSHYLITDWAWTLAKKGKSSEIVDERIRQSGDEESVMERFVLVGILCSHVIVAFRPQMWEAVKMLEGVTEIPEIPDRPWPLMLQGRPETGKSTDSLVISDSAFEISLSECS